MLCCGAWPNLGYRLDKPWVRPYTVNYKSDSRMIFVICISLTRFHSTQFGTVSCQALCRSSSSTLRRTRLPGPPIKLEVNLLKFWQLTYLHCAASDSCHSVFCACSFQPFCENLIFMRSQFNFVLFAMFNTLSFFCQNLNMAMTRVHVCHWSNQRYALACAYFLRCVDSIARSRSAIVWDSLSGPGTGCELERSQNAPEPLWIPLRAEGFQEAGRSYLLHWAWNARTVVVSLGLGLASTAIADTAIPSVHPVPIPWTPSPCHWRNEEILTREIFAYMTP